MSVSYPRISEKAYQDAVKQNVYTFVVAKNQNKHTIKAEIEQEFGVTVLSVNMATLKGKPKRFMMRRGKQSVGSRRDIKKAYVTLKEGDSIPVFTELEDDNADATAAIGAKKGKK